MKLTGCFYIVMILLSINSIGAAQKYIRLSDFNSCGALKMVKQYLPTNPIILEAGAYDGHHTLEFLKRWPHATIYSFEPLPEGFEMLASRTRGFSNVFSYQMALSDKIGVAPFYVSKNILVPNNKGSSSSLLPPTDNYVLEFPQLQFNAQILVNTTTIDQWAQAHHVEHIDFMWLDMQGGEMSALLAAGPILKTVKVIQTEVAFSEGYKGQWTYSQVEQWFTSQGFEMVAADCDITTATGEGNALFVRKELVA